MKTKIVPLLCAVAALLLSACGANSDLLVKRSPVVLRPAQTNSIVVTNFMTVTNFTTNLVTLTVTNQDTGAITTAQQPQILPEVKVTQLVTTNTVVLPAVTYTNIALSGGVESVVKGAGNVAGVAGVPFASTIAAGLLALSHLFFGFRNRRAMARAQAQIDQTADDHDKTKEALNVAKDAVSTLVSNFEELRKTALTVPGYTPELDKKVMDRVQQVQNLMGVKPLIESAIEDHTGDTVLNHAPDALKQG